MIEARPHGNETWPPARVAELVELVGSGIGFADIARRLGVTRAAAIGKAHRLGMKHSAPSVPHKTDPAKTSTHIKWTAEMDKVVRNGAHNGRTIAQVTAQLGVANPGSVSWRARTLGVSFLKFRNPNPPPASARTFGGDGQPQARTSKVHPLAQYDQAFVTTLKLEPHHCRWSVGDPRADDFGYCGAQHVPGKPYCPAHCERAYVAIQPVWAKTGKALVRSLRRYAA